MFVYAQRLAAWANELHNDDDWTGTLTNAFDAVGFSEDYVATITPPADEKPRKKAIKDNVWGMIELDLPTTRLINCPLFQKLRSISQLGFTYWTYPTARHSRFEHSLGVYYVVQQLLKSFRNTASTEEWGGRGVKAIHFDEEEEQLACHAALLHDIGHVTFSHVTENIFLLRGAERNIGPYKIDGFIGNFRDHFEGRANNIDPTIPAGRVPDLSEILSVAIITSDRFRRFYEAATRKSGVEGIHPVYQISALILGERIRQNDLALPQVISGAVDADKIDYMIRDSQACGISLGIDISRVFLRAGVYQVDYNDVPKKPDGLKKNNKVKIFVIDQSGTDTVREMAASRQSLFSRVYYHQLTRNVERHFSDIFDRIATAAVDGVDDGNATEPDATHTNECAKFMDYLHIWTMAEDTLIYRLQGAGMPADVRQATSKLTARDLLKRAASFSLEELRSTLPEWLYDSPFKDAILRQTKETLKNMKAEIENFSDHRAFCDLIVEECRDIRQRLEAAAPLDFTGPGGDVPSDVRFVPFPDEEKIKLQSTNILTASGEIVRSGQRLASYFEAGDIPLSRGYLLVPEGWREIALIAFQKVLFEKFKRAYKCSYHIEGNLTRELSTEQSSQNDISETENIELRGIHRPILDVSTSGHECKINVRKVKEWQTILASGDYYDDAPPLLSGSKNDQKIDEIDRVCRAYSGECGWRVTPDSIRKFVSQFPPGIQGHAIDMLCRIEFLDRDNLVHDVLGAVGCLPDFGQRTIHLVPFSPSSGHLVRVYLGKIIECFAGKRLRLHASLRDALAETSEGDQITFVDDNVASGGQASKQIRALMGDLGPEERDANIFFAPLPENEREELRNRRVSFAFSVADQTGVETMVDAAKSLGLSLEVDDVKFSKSLEFVSGRDVIHEDLRDFLDTVGRGVMFNRVRVDHPADEPEIHADWVSERTLGYGQLQGLMVTPFNVPTSTYTALWCPGSYAPDPDKAADPAADRFPWIPLFIRNGMFRYLVLP